MGMRWRTMGMCGWAMVLMSVCWMYPMSSAVSVGVRGSAWDGDDAAAVALSKGKRPTACDGVQGRTPVLRPASMAALDMGRRASALGVSAAHCVSVRWPTTARNNAVHALLIAIKAHEEDVAQLLFGYCLHAVPVRVGSGRPACHAPRHHAGNLLLVAVKLDEQNLLQLLHVRERCLFGKWRDCCWLCSSSGRLGSLLCDRHGSNDSPPLGDDLLNLR
mmetsp:Transcript_18276/g.70622  ORF Transcript_18276/g.70622 Transcript_18276/m.70622 type:complete len:218 (-) Transcript_18276:307-960(-)